MFQRLQRRQRRAVAAVERAQLQNGGLRRRAVGRAVEAAPGRRQLALQRQHVRRALFDARFHRPAQFPFSYHDYTPPRQVQGEYMPFFGFLTAICQA